MKALLKHIFHKEKNNEETDQNKIKIYLEGDENDFILEDTVEARSVEDILKNSSFVNSYIGIELYNKKNTQIISKRRLEAFEIPALIHREYDEDDRIEAKFFIFGKTKKKKKINGKSMIAKYSVKKEVKQDVKNETLLEKNVNYKRADSEHFKEAKIKITTSMIELHELKNKNQITHIHFLLMNHIVMHESDPNAFYIKTENVKYMFICKNNKDCSKIFTLLKEQTTNVHLNHLMSDLKFKINDAIQNKTEKLFQLKNINKHTIFENKSYRKAIFDDLCKTKDISICELIENFVLAYKDNKETKMDNCIHRLINKGVINLNELLLLNNPKSLKNSIIQYIEQKENNNSIKESEIKGYVEISNSSNLKKSEANEDYNSDVLEPDSDIIDRPIDFNLKIRASESLKESTIINDHIDEFNHLSLKKSQSYKIKKDIGIDYLRESISKKDSDINEEKITDIVKTLDKDQIKSFIEENNVKRDTMFYKYCFDKLCDYLISNTDQLNIIDLYLQRAFKKDSFSSNVPNISVFTDAKSII